MKFALYGMTLLLVGCSNAPAGPGPTGDRGMLLLSPHLATLGSHVTVSAFGDWHGNFPSSLWLQSADAPVALTIDRTQAIKLGDVVPAPGEFQLDFVLQADMGTLPDGSHFLVKAGDHLEVVGQANDFSIFTELPVAPPPAQ